MDQKSAPPAPDLQHRAWTRGADKEDIEGNKTSQEKAPSKPSLLCQHLFSWFCTSLSSPPPPLGWSCPNRDSLIAKNCKEPFIHVSQSTTSAVYNSPTCPWHSMRCCPCPLCTGSTRSPGSPFSHPSPLHCFQGNREKKDLNKTEPKKAEDAKPTPSQVNREMCSVPTPAKGVQTSARGQVSTRHSTAGCFEDGSLLLESAIPTTWCLLLWEGLMPQDSQSRSGNISATSWMHPLRQILGVFARWEKPGFTLQMNLEITIIPDQPSRRKEQNKELRAQQKYAATTLGPPPPPQTPKVPTTRQSLELQKAAEHL